MGFLRYADNQLLDILCGIPEHASTAGVGIDITRPVHGRDGANRIAAAVFQIGDHARQAQTAKACLRIKDVTQHGELFLLDFGEEFLDRQGFPLDGKIGLTIACFNDVTRRQPIVVDGNTLADRCHRQNCCQEDMNNPRPQRQPPACQKA